MANVSDLTPAALLAITVLMILTGRLVPRRALDDLREERDAWRRAAEENAEKVNVLLPATNTTAAFIEATMKAARENREAEPSP